MPLYQYDHNIGESITGGFVYRGNLVPNLYGKYIFADFEYGDIWSLEYEEGNSPEVSTLGDLGPYSVTSFGTDQYNELYICSFNGTIYKFTQTYSMINHGDLTLKILSLHQNYPNPFNPTTQFRYDVPEAGHVTIMVYDLMGRKIRTLVDKNQKIGHRLIQWNATNDLGQPVSAGSYLYTIQVGEYRKTRKMVLLK